MRVNVKCSCGACLACEAVVNRAKDRADSPLYRALEREEAPDGCHASTDLKDVGYAGFRSSARRAVNGCEKMSSRAFSNPKNQATLIPSLGKRSVRVED
jgi:hypothetical protein